MATIQIEVSETVLEHYGSEALIERLQRMLLISLSLELRLESLIIDNLERISGKDATSK